MAAGNVEEKADVALFYHAHDEEEASTLKDALLGEGLTVKSYEDFQVGGYSPESRGSLIKNSWCVVLLLTEDFVNDTGMNEFETYTSLHHSIQKNLKKVFPVIHCDESSIPTALGCISGIYGSRPVDEQAAKISKGVKHLKPEPDVLQQGYQLIEPARKILKFTASELTKYFRMDDKIKAIHGELKKKVEENNPDDGKRHECWIECITDEMIKNDGGRPKGQRFTKNVTLKSATTELLHGLDGPTGHLCLVSLLLNKTPLKKHTDCAKLAEYLDPDNIFDLLKKCKVFPKWNPQELEAIEQLKSNRSKEAHQPVESSTDSEKELVESIKKTSISSYETLVVLPFKAEISKIVGEAGATANQSNVGEDQHDDAAS
ncbi:uncharacterized protein LOC110975443 isoform X1 [Acanthaster planci]|uniref:Uncharacterized protein LOC110975443 isoform X1 n=1 Tax=Acanthaster planci TaxID=133434 RepID=A0A8B7XTT6_ACAPL|nr:uncharacterized protein LOC110975443 isoform X1 [Acanthaster planci]